MERRPISKRLNEHRRLVLSIFGKVKFLKVLEEKLANIGGSLVEPANGNLDLTIKKIQMINDLKAEIGA